MKKIERNLKITLNNEWDSGKVLISPLLVSKQKQRS